MDKFIVSILFSAFMVVSRAHNPQMTLDQMIANAAITSTAFDFIQNDNTVLVELDIKYTKDEWELIKEAGLAKSEKRKRRALSRMRRKGIHGNRWTGAVVPYTIARYFEDEERTQIHKAIAEYHKHTCIQFKERSNENNYIIFVDGGGCSSFVGMKGGEQEVTLGRGCRQHGIIMHEVGHAIGCHHEQTRPDRDDYVTIQQNNIPPNVYFNFQKYTWAVIKNWQIPYDYASIMHYGATAFSYNGQPTIVAKQQKFQNVMGNRNGFSFRDIKLVNAMYQCDAGCPNKPDCPGEAYVDKSCQCICPGYPTKVCEEGDDGIYAGAEATTNSDGGGGGSNTGECVDRRGNDCTTWKNRGFCTTDAYKTFMAENCQKSCDLCGEPNEMECVDQKNECQSWEKAGYCQNTYVAFMRTNCPKACGLCSEAAKQCTDGHQKCYNWAYVGECQRNPTWMKENCRKSCNACEGKMSNPVSDCVDMNNHCAEWSEHGECNKNPSYMHNYCKKSCNRCGSMGDYSGVADCTDSNQYCEFWAKAAECGKNPLYMNEQCKKSCGKCGNSPNGEYNTNKQSTKYCVDKNTYCAYWADSNECLANPAYMLTECAKSCQQC